jgi:hypothetical protein
VKRSLYLPLVALLALAPAARAGHFFSCCNAGIHCMIPPPECPDCGDACPSCHHCWAWQSEHAQKLIDQLANGECCCDRIKAAEKLGCCLHANWCCNPEIADALVAALECDTCWEVRRAAAYSLALQGARTQYTVLALYLASKLDHHYMVRDRAKEALDILTLCRRECYKQLFDSADKEIGKIKPYYNPTNEQCVHLVLDCGCITVHVCKKPPEEKKPAKEECLIPIKIIEDGTCPTHHGCQACQAAGAPVPLAPGAVLPAPPPGMPEQLQTPPVPVPPQPK